MEIIQDYDIYFSTCSSSLIHITDLTTQNKSVTKKDDDKKQEITSLSLGCRQNELLLGYKDGTVKTYNINTEVFSRIDEKPDKIVSVCPYNKKVITGTDKGNIYIDDTCVVKNEDDTKTLRRVVVNSFDKNIIGYGGVDNDLKLYDLKTEQASFIAKGDRHDELNLKQPISVSDVVFFDPSSGIQVGTVTLQGQIRLYDIRAQRRPVKIFKQPKDTKTLNYKETRAYTKISRVDDPQKLIIGTNKGCIQTFDFRKDLKPLKASQAFMGAVVDIVSVDDKVMSCGLDRYWKVHTTDKLEEIHQEYMKIQMTGMVLIPKRLDDSDSETPKKKKKIK